MTLNQWFIQFRSWRTNTAHFVQVFPGSILRKTLLNNYELLFPVVCHWIFVSLPLSFYADKPWILQQVLNCLYREVVGLFVIQTEEEVRGRERAHERTQANTHTQTASWDISVGWAKAWARRLGGSGECQDRRAKRLLGNDRMGMVTMATQLAQAVRGNR